MAEYGMEDIFEEVILTLDGNRFRLREATKSLAAKADPVEKRLAEVSDSDEDTSDEPTDELAGLLIDLIDIVLEPLGDGNGTRKHAKTVLSRSYKNDEIGLPRLSGLAEFLQEKMDSRRRPTSQPTSSE